MLKETKLSEMLNELKQDERLTYKDATVFANAPLALIQLGLKTKVHLLETILELPLSKFPLTTNQKT